MKIVMILVLSLFATTTFADTVVCPHVGNITLNGDNATIVYASDMGFNDVHDTAYKIGEDDRGITYNSSKWGASFTIPHALLSRAAFAADVYFFQAETSPVSQICTLE